MPTFVRFARSLALVTGPFAVVAVAVPAVLGGGCSSSTATATATASDATGCGDGACDADGGTGFDSSSACETGPDAFCFGGPLLAPELPSEVGGWA